MLDFIKVVGNRLDNASPYYWKQFAFYELLTIVEQSLYFANIPYTQNTAKA